jgi:MoaA/NifB/PqqE/SkfB family radical SAM enzyme
LYRYDQITSLHLEITDKCNASCPQCFRSDHGGAVNPLLPLTELRLTDIRQIFPWEFVERLDKVLLCGGYGDAMMAEDTIEICEFFREVNPKITIGMHTNGSARIMRWWRELAVVLRSPSYVRFSLDGLADTNEIYRRGTRWETIMTNAKAFMAAGGRAEWDFLVFEHNQHQVAEAEALSKQMGFAAFHVKKTMRFFDRDTHKIRPDFPIKDGSGAVVGYLRPASPEWTNEALVSLGGLRKKHGSFQGYLDATEITCKAVKEGSLYVSADGYAIPCCYLGSHIHRPGLTAINDLFLHEVDKIGGIERLNAKHRPLQEIVDGSIFQGAVPEGWQRGKKRNLTCARICGDDFQSNYP